MAWGVTGWAEVAHAVVVELRKSSGETDDGSDCAAMNDTVYRPFTIGRLRRAYSSLVIAASFVTVFQLRTVAIMPDSRMRGCASCAASLERPMPPGSRR